VEFKQGDLKWVVSYEQKGVIQLVRLEAPDLKAAVNQALNLDLEGVQEIIVRRKPESGRRKPR